MERVSGRLKTKKSRLEAKDTTNSKVLITAKGAVTPVKEAMVALICLKIIASIHPAIIVAVVIPTRKQVGYRYK